MSQMFTRGIAEIAEGYVSVKRLEKFLQCDEIDQSVKERDGNEIDNVAILVRDLKATWTTDENDSNPENVEGASETVRLEKENLLSKQYILNQINVCVKKGSLIGIVGPIGSGTTIKMENMRKLYYIVSFTGKSSFLQALINEMPLECGSVNITGSVSYASQEPWIFPGSVRQNITFNSSFDEKRCDQVIRCCALDVDIGHFENGDKLLTLPGDRGISLSGGQKARVKS